MSSSRIRARSSIHLSAAVLFRQAPCEELCQQIQKREWELLFDWCYRQAVVEG